MARDNAVAFRQIGEWHMPNRVIDAAENKIPLTDFWTYIPTRCHWCKRERKIADLEINAAMHLHCLDRRACEKSRTGKDPEVVSTPQASTTGKKVVVRRK